MPTFDYDIIVIGGGAMGLSAAYHCSKAGKKVLMLEQYKLFNDRASSKGLSRFFRIVYADPLLCLLAQAAFPLWKDLETEAKETLITQTGVLFYGMTEVFSREGNLKRCQEVMDNLEITYEAYDSTELQERYPVLRDVPSSAFGLYQADAGFAHARKTLEALFRLAVAHGVEVQEGESVSALSDSPDDGAVEVRTSSGVYRGNKAILCPGGWANSLLRFFGMRLNLSLWSVTYAYFKVEDTNDYPMWFYFGEADGKDENLYYGLPPIDPVGKIKAGGDFTEDKTDDPDRCPLDPDPDMLNLSGRFLTRTFRGVDPTPLDAERCVYTMTQDGNFVLDRLPDHPNVILFTGGTGQAFKFTPIIGKILCQLALTGTTEFDIGPFSIERAGILS